MADDRLRVAVTLEQCWHRVPGGTATSVLELVRELDRRPGLDLIGVGARHPRRPAGPFTPPIEVAQLPLPRPVLYEAWHGLRRPAVERATGPVDVVHATAVAVPPKTAPLVVTIHDLAFLAEPSHATGHGNRFFRRGLELTRRDADLVLCPSAATRDECLVAGIEGDRLRVVPWGVHPVEVTDDDLRGVRRRYGLHHPYVLFCGTQEPRKNLKGLVDAFVLVAGENPEVDLVVVGPSGWNEDLGARIDAAGLDRRTRTLGFVPDADKHAVYAGASVFCYPSLREGFGLPVLEAMAQGAPVVTSAGTATAEVAGGAALLIDPREPGAIAGELLRVLDDASLAGELAARGRARAAEFPWSRTADLTLDAYRAVASPSPARPVRPRSADAGERPGGAAIAVNLLWLVPGTVGGSEEYLTRQLRGLAEAAPSDLDLTLFVLAPFLDAHPDLVAAFPTVAWPGDGRSKLRRVAAENTWLASQLGHGNFDLVHHGGGVVPAHHVVPAVLTIHDLQPLVLPGNFHPVKRHYLGAMLPRSAHRARLVLTPSDQVGRSVVELLGVPEARVRTVPHGIEPVGPRTPERDAAVDVVRRRYRIDGPYFLLPGITHRHKNHVGLVQAFALVLATRPEAHLVLAGGAGAAEGALLAEIERLGAGRRVHRLGRIPRADVDALLDGATALTFPSRFEGFGAPVLEAMARGCPVIASNAAALPEVLDGAGRLLPPDDLRGWADAMISLLDDPAERRRLAEAGRRRAGAYTWHRSAAALLDAYRWALAEGAQR